MKIGEFVGLVMLRINGGQVVPDNSVLPSDVRAMIPAANNMVLDDTYNKNHRFNEGNIMPSEMYSYYRLPVNNNARPFTAELPISTVALKGDYGIGPVTDDSGNFYAPVPNIGVANFNYYSQTAPGIKWYRRRGKLFQIYTDNPMLSHIEVPCIVDASMLSDDDDLPVQAGMEAPILDLLVQWFTGQKQMPYDNDNDSHDINAAK
jgi:hypothetical protein